LPFGESTTAITARGRGVAERGSRACAHVRLMRRGSRSRQPARDQAPPTITLAEGWGYPPADRLPRVCACARERRQVRDHACVGRVRMAV
jgi:hypothetical protein